MMKFLRKEEGSFSIEASLVFPFYLMFIIACMFFVIVFFQIGVVQYVASSAAQSGAYTWNNSHKDINTSEFEKTQYLGGPEGDSSYWRVTDTVNELVGMFGFDISSDLKDSKIANTEGNKRFNYSIEANYRSMVFYNEVRVKAKSNLYLPGIITEAFGTSAVEAESVSVYTDTPEMIRTFNFAKYLYTATTSDNGDIQGMVGKVKELISN